jgi:hyperosmotically inducible periplasmic protein
VRRFFNGLLLGIIIGASALWFYGNSHSIPSMKEAEQSAKVQAGKARDLAQSATEQAKQALPGVLDALELRSDDIRKEVAETGKVVRRRARDLGSAVADATSDSRITAAIKAKLAADPDLSSLGISVDTTAGRVTMAGTVASPDLVGKAMVVALETEGVHEVISTLQVR